MARHETRKVGEGGTVVIPAEFRRQLGIEPGDTVTFEGRKDEVVILPPRKEKKTRRTGERGER